MKFTGTLDNYLTYTAGAFYLFETNRDNFGAAGNLAGVLGIPGFTNFPIAFGDE